MHLRLLLPLLASATALHAQGAPSKGWPTAPRPLPEAEEIALATSAAPPEISAQADVWVLRGTEFVKARAGTNGSACMLGRDLHDGSRYPICYDAEGARTWMLRELLEGTLRAKGRRESEVKEAVKSAYASGALRMPERAAMAWMMSPQQVLFSSPDSAGVRVGAWWPHVMILMPGVKPAQLGLASPSKVDVVQIHAHGETHAELIVKVPTWSDGTPARPAQRPASSP